jgi:hypothetical protein
MLFNDPARHPYQQAPFAAAELSGTAAPDRADMILCDRGLGRPMNRDELHDWMQEVTGPHFDAARFSGKWASLEHLDPAARQRDFLKWLRSRQDSPCFQLAPHEAAGLPGTNPVCMGIGSIHAVYRFDDHPDLVFGFDARQVGTQARYNAQFAAAPDHRPLQLDDLLHEGQQAERFLLGKQREHFGAAMDSHKELDLIEWTLPGRLVKLVILEGRDPRLLTASGRPGVSLYNAMEIDGNRLYSFPVTMFSQTNLEHIYRRLKSGDGAVGLQVAEILTPEGAAALGNLRPGQEALSEAEYDAGSGLWIGGGAGRSMSAAEEALFRKMCAQDKRSNLAELMERCEADPALGRAMEEWAVAAAHFANDTESMINILGHENLVFAQGERGRWAAEMTDPMPMNFWRMRERYIHAVNVIGAGGELPNSYVVDFTRYGAFMASVNGFLHWRGRPERIAAPGLAPNPAWSVIREETSRIVALRRRPDPSKLLVEDYPVWKVAQPVRNGFEGSTAMIYLRT